MKYIINENNDNIIENILHINNIDLDKLDVSNFTIDSDIKIINEFKAELLNNSDKKFLIVGDYDCDGICATTIIHKLLDDLNIKNNYYIPSRSKQGYGLNNQIVDNAIENKFDCILCVDNGVVANDSLKYAKDNNIKVFIIDHHEYQDKPYCICLLHPCLFENKYEDMCAAGICCLLSLSFRYDELTLVLGGLASLADMVKVLNYNRYLIIKMLEILKTRNIYPIKYLLGNNPLTYKSIQYNVIPKINAVSRLDDLMNVNYVVKYLLADEKMSIEYFNKIETINEARKKYTNQMYQDALNKIDLNKNVCIVFADDYLEGICGLVANKLMYQFNKPFIVLSHSDGMYKGSGRSVYGSNLYDYLSGCKELFDNYGGHAQAVGISISDDNLPKLINYCDNNVFEYDEIVNDVIKVDHSDLTYKLIDDIESLAPYGTGFVLPKLCIDGHYEKKYIVSNKYPKFIINDLVSGISFNSDLIDKPFSNMIGELQVDNYHKDKLSFLIEDLI